MYLQEYDLSFHPLMKAEEYTKNSYLRSLMSIGSVENDEELFQFVKTIVQYMASSFQTTETIDSIVKHSLSFTSQDWINFSREMKSTGLSPIFIVDSLLMIFNGGYIQNKVLEYITNSANMVGLQQEELNELIAFVKIILEKDNQKFKELFLHKNYVNHGKFYVYTRLFSSFYVANSLTDYQEIEYDDDIQHLVLENINMNNFIDININISEKTKVILCNCHFHDVQFLSSITCENIERLDVVECTFEGIHEDVFSISECGTVKFVNCSFVNCPNASYEDCAATSAICISAENVQSLRLEHCQFEKCLSFPSLEIDTSLSVDGIAAIAKIEDVHDFRLIDCHFKNCITCTVEGCEHEGFLFKLTNSECHKAQNCIVENCCPSGDARLKL